MRYRLALGLAVVLAACSGGGSSIQTVPTLPWGSFRHDPSNSAVGGSINQNNGTVKLLVEPTPGTVTLSTPTIDLNNNIVIGTTNGVMSVGPDGGMRWVFKGYQTLATPSGTQVNCSTACDPVTDTMCTPVGSVSSSPTITAGGVIVFGTEATADQPAALFAIQQNSDAVKCVWFYPPAGEPTFSVTSSAIALVDTLDFSLLTVYSAGNDGFLRALNSDGSLRWSFPTGGAAGQITSTPALGTTNIYVATPDGVVSAIDFSGHLRTNGQVSVGAPPLEPFQPSPIAGPSVYTIGTNGTLFALSFASPQSQMKWQFAARPSTQNEVPQNPIVGSPAVFAQNFGFMATDVADTIVYVVDTQNFAYGVRDLTGELFQPQRCTKDLNPDCRTDSCNPTGVLPPVDTCIPSTNRCMTSGQSCSQDSCVTSSEGNCVPADGFVLLVDQPATISGSPIVSDDPFVVVGTSDGHVCARSTANRVPGQNTTPPTTTWRGGHCSTTTSQTCVIDQDCPLQTCTDGHCSTTTSQACGPDQLCPHESCSPPDCQNNGPCVSPGGHCSVTAAQICTADDNCPTGETCVAAGPHCSMTTVQTCALDNNCPTNETCVYVGCIPLTDNNGNEDPGPVLSSPLIGENSRIYVTTAMGLYEIK